MNDERRAEIAYGLLRERGLLYSDAGAWNELPDRARRTWTESTQRVLGSPAQWKTSSDHMVRTFADGVLHAEMHALLSLAP